MSSYTTVSTCAVGTGTGQCASCNPPVNCNTGFDCSFYLTACSSTNCCSKIEDSTMTLTSYYLCLPTKTAGGWNSYTNATTSKTMYYNCAFMGA